MLVNEYGNRNDPTVILLAPMMISGSDLYGQMSPYSSTVTLSIPCNYRLFSFPALSLAPLLTKRAKQHINPLFTFQAPH
jgi:hypothetical protein